MPGEGFEPPTFGLQNRCTTTVLTRREARQETKNLAKAPVAAPPMSVSDLSWLLQMFTVLLSYCPRSVPRPRASSLAFSPLSPSLLSRLSSSSRSRTPSSPGFRPHRGTDRRGELSASRYVVGSSRNASRSMLVALPMLIADHSRGPRVARRAVRAPATAGRVHRRSPTLHPSAMVAVLILGLTLSARAVIRTCHPSRLS